VVEVVGLVMMEVVEVGEDFLLPQDIQYQQQIHIQSLLVVAELEALVTRLMEILMEVALISTQLQHLFPLHHIFVPVVEERGVGELQVLEIVV
jgi:hypothetical protein